MGHEIFNIVLSQNIVNICQISMKFSSYVWKKRLGTLTAWQCGMQKECADKGTTVIEHVFSVGSKIF